MIVPQIGIEIRPTGPGPLMVRKKEDRAWVHSWSASGGGGSVDGWDHSRPHSIVGRQLAEDTAVVISIAPLTTIIIVNSSFLPAIANSL